MSGHLVLWGARRYDRVPAIWTAQRLVAMGLPPGGEILGAPDYARDLVSVAVPLNEPERSGRDA